MWIIWNSHSYLNNALTEETFWWTLSTDFNIYKNEKVHRLSKSEANMPAAATVQVMLPELILQEYLIYVTKKAPNQKWLTLGTNTWPKKILKMRYFN